MITPKYLKVCSIYVPLSPPKKTAKTRRKHSFCRFFSVFRPFPPSFYANLAQKPNLKPNFLCNHFYQRFCFLFKTIAADRLSVAIFPSEWKRANNSIAAHVGRFGGIPESGSETAKKSGAERRRKNNVLFIQPPAPQAACAFADFRTRHRQLALMPRAYRAPPLPARSALPRFPQGRPKR